MKYLVTLLPAIAFLFVVRPALAEIPRPMPPRPDGVQALFDRIHELAANDDWKKGGFKDEVIEKAIDKYTNAAANAAELSDFRVPIRFEAVAPPPAGGPPRVDGQLLVGRDIDLENSTVRQSIILSDGIVRVDRADQCIIVARGAVIVARSSSNSIIIGGTYVKLGGYDGRPPDPKNGSLVICLGWVDVATGYGTLISSPESIVIGRAEGAVFINTPVPAARLPFGNTPSREVKVAELLGEKMRLSSLTERMEVQGVLQAWTTEAAIGRGEQRRFLPRGLVFRFDGKQYVAEIGKTIVNDDGAIVDELRHWRLSVVNERFALFVGTDANAVLQFAKK